MLLLAAPTALLAQNHEASGRKDTLNTLEEAIAAIEEMKAAHEAEKTAILNKNSELIAREKAAKAAQDEADEALKASELAKQQAEELREAAEAEAAEKSGDVEKVKQSMQKKHDIDITKLKDAYAALEAAHATLTIDNAIAAAMSAAGVRPDSVDMITRALKADAKMVDGVAMAGDISFADHLSAQMKSDAMKPFIAAPHNSGGGATGSTAVASRTMNKPVTGDDYNAFFKLASEDKDAANQLAESWQMPELKQP